jgi:pimeloyl-ACP methyl ester carboxylesterase
MFGLADPFLDRGLVEPPPSWVQPAAKNVRCRGGHWLHWDQPAECWRELAEHLKNAKP